MAAEGFDGVHFDLEPLRDGQPGYLELLSEVRTIWDRIGRSARRRLAPTPFGIPFVPLNRSFWSARSTGHDGRRHADDSDGLRHESPPARRVRGVRSRPDPPSREVVLRGQKHEFLIGIPAYHDVPEYSDPSVENIGNAALGVRSALESFSEKPECFRGVSIYANWVTDRASGSSSNNSGDISRKCRATVGRPPAFTAGRLHRSDPAIEARARLPVPPARSPRDRDEQSQAEALVGGRDGTDSRAIGIERIFGKACQIDEAIEHTALEVSMSECKLSDLQRSNLFEFQPRRSRRSLELGQEQIDHRSNLRHAGKRRNRKVPPPRYRLKLELTP